MLPGLRNPVGALRVTEALPDTSSTFQGGIVIDPTGAVHITLINPVQEVVNGFGVRNSGMLCVKDIGSPNTYNQGYGFDSTGHLFGVVDGTVDVTDPFVGGVRVTDDGRVYMTTTIAPPVPTKLFNLTEFPLPSELTFTRGSIATGIDENGFFTLANVNEPRSYRIQGQKENLGTWFENTSINHWLNRSTQAANAIVTLNGGSAIAPDKEFANIGVPQGVITAVAAVGSRLGSGFVDLNTTPGATFDVSITSYWAPWGPNNYKPLLVVTADNGNGIDAVYATCLINTISGAIVQKNVNSVYTELIPPTATKLPSGMWKVVWSLRFTQDAVPRSTISLTFQIRNELDQAQYTADGVSGVQFGCLQFENTNSPTSYIPTEQAWVTRSQDALAQQNAPFTAWFNPVEGTILAESTPTSTATGGGSPVWAMQNITTPSPVNRMYLFFRAATSNGTQVTVNDVIEVDLTSNDAGVANDEFCSTCVAYKLDNYAVAGNKSTLKTDNVGSVPSGINRLLFQATARNVAIKEFAYWNTRLANGQVDELAKMGRS